jgi:hypothetical protein
MEGGSVYLAKWRDLVNTVITVGLHKRRIICSPAERLFLKRNSLIHGIV